MPWMARRVGCSILNELRLPASWLYNFVRRQKLGYFGHVARRGGLGRTMVQGMVTGRGGRGETEMGERHHGCVWYNDSGKQSGGGQASISQ